MLRSFTRSSSALLALAFAACARHAQSEEALAPNAGAPMSSSASAAPGALAYDSARVAREYRGAYTTGFEMSWFEPCGAPAGDRMWWETLTDDALRQRDSLLAIVKVPPTTGLAVRWRGTISSRMPAGHMGRGSRYMLVTSIIEIHPVPSSGACSGRAS